jgi:hypothetical protein
MEVQMLLSAERGKGKALSSDDSCLAVANWFLVVDVALCSSTSSGLKVCPSGLESASVHGFPSRLIPIHFFLYILASAIIALCIPQRPAFRSTTIAPWQLGIDSWTRYRLEWFALEQFEFEFEFVSSVLFLIMDMDMVDLLSLSCSLLQIGFSC